MCLQYLLYIIAISYLSLVLGVYYTWQFINSQVYYELNVFSSRGWRVLSALDWLWLLAKSYGIFKELVYPHRLRTAVSVYSSGDERGCDGRDCIVIT